MADEKCGHFDTTINTLKFLSEHQEEKCCLKQEVLFHTMAVCLLEEEQAVYKCVGMGKTQGICCADTCSLEAEILLDCSSELFFFLFTLRCWLSIILPEIMLLF